MFNPVWPRKKPAKQRLKPELEGFRIRLKSPELQDYPAWVTVRRNNAAFLKPYEPKWADDALSKDFFIRRLQKQDNELKAGRGVYFLIHHKADRKIIGGINLNDVRYGAARHASLGYWLDEAYQGQGYMSEAARLSIKYAFDVLKLRRLNAACLPDNDRSINLLLKLGFIEEGYAKAYLQINGTWQDHRLFGLIRP